MTKFKKPNMRQIVIAKPRVRAWWAPDAPAVITAATKVTVAPKPPDPTHTNTHSR
jgi:hypothetical protein